MNAHCAAFMEQLTSSNHSRLVLLISDLFLLDVSTREEKPHHSFEELVHELDGERHHVHLMEHRVDVKTPDTDFTASAGNVPHLKVLLHGDSSHRGAHFAEDAQSELTAQLAVTLRTKDNLQKDDDGRKS